MGDLGVYLWTNKTLYSYISLSPITPDAQPTPLTLPSHLLVQGKEGQEQEDKVKMKEGEQEEFASTDQISSDLITLAKLSGSRWINLLLPPASCCSGSGCSYHSHLPILSCGQWQVLPLQVYTVPYILHIIWYSLQ